MINEKRHILFSRVSCAKYLKNHLDTKVSFKDAVLLLR